MLFDKILNKDSGGHKFHYPVVVFMLGVSVCDYDDFVTTFMVLAHFCYKFIIRLCLAVPFIVTTFPGCYVKTVVEVE